MFVVWFVLCIIGNLMDMFLNLGMDFLVFIFIIFFWKDFFFFFGEDWDVCIDDDLVLFFLEVECFGLVLIFIICKLFLKFFKFFIVRGEIFGGGGVGGKFFMLFLGGLLCVNEWVWLLLFEVIGVIKFIWFG